MSSERSLIIATLSKLPFEGEHEVRWWFHRGRVAAWGNHDPGREENIRALRGFAMRHVPQVASGLLATAGSVYLGVRERSVSYFAQAGYNFLFAMTNLAAIFAQTRLARQVAQTEPLPDTPENRTFIHDARAAIPYRAPESTPLEFAVTKGGFAIHLASALYVGARAIDAAFSDMQ